MRLVGLMRTRSSRFLSEEDEECAGLDGRLVLLAAGDIKCPMLWRKAEKYAIATVVI